MIEEKKLTIRFCPRENNLAGLHLDKRLQILRQEDFLIQNPELRLTQKGRKKAKKMKLMIINGLGLKKVIKTGQVRISKVIHHLKVQSKVKSQ